MARKKLQNEITSDKAKALEGSFFLDTELSSSPTRGSFFLNTE